MTIHIITPCSRPENLQRIFESINIDCYWWIVFDRETIPEIKLKNVNECNVDVKLMAIKGGVVGKKQINHALDQINNGWVYVLDDDNLLHPRFKMFIKTFESFVLNYKKHRIEGVIFSQELSPGVVRHNNSENIKVCQIDQAQFLLKRTLIKDNRYQNSYEADGLFISKFYKENKDKFIITNAVLSYYNRLKWS